MALNYIWIFFFISAFITALVKLIFFGDIDVFPNMVASTFETSKLAFDISIGLTGALSLWLGILKIGEKGGIIKIFSRLIAPLFSKLFPELPDKHPAFGSIVMNIAANMLGLDNAATPMGLKAMEQMQDVNPKKNTASNAQIMFLVLNTSGLTIIPISIMVYRAELGAADPSDIFIPIMLATYFSTMAGLIAVSIFQKINLFNKTILSYLGGLTLFIVGLIYWLSGLPKEEVQQISRLASNIILMSIIVLFITLAFIRKVNVYEAFIEGAKDGFKIAVKIIPYLVAILVSIAVFRAAGAMDYLINGIIFVFDSVGINTDFVQALPTALMKPLSGSGARGMLMDLMKTEGADSFASRVASTVQGATDTTFYVIAVYFGAVGIKNTRYAVTAGLIADFTGIIAAILIAYLFFH